MSPGELLQRLLDERKMTQVHLAILLGRPLKTINEIIKGKSRLTENTALQLEKVFPLSAEEWLKREAQYRLAIARQALKDGGET